MGEIKKLVGEEAKAFKVFRDAEGVKVPSAVIRVEDTPEAKRRQAAYARRQVEHLDRVLNREGLEEWLRSHLQAAQAAWAELAGPPPFQFGDYCRRHGIDGPDRTVMMTEAAEATAMVARINEALREDPPPGKYPKVLRAWAGAYRDRAHRLGMEFAAEGSRKGPPAKELARKANKRQQSTVTRTKMRGK